jgi:hypothetical protein
MINDQSEEGVVHCIYVESRWDCLFGLMVWWESSFKSISCSKATSIECGEEAVMSELGLKKSRKTFELIGLIIINYYPYIDGHK